MTTMTSPSLKAVSEGPPLVETRELSKRYGSNVLALDALTVHQQVLTGLVGANGAGKSTLIKILLGLLGPTAAAPLLGYDVLRQGTLLRQFVGYMPEHDCLPSDVSATEFVGHMAQINGLSRAPRPASARPTCCATSAYSKSAIGPSAPTRRA